MLSVEELEQLARFRDGALSQDEAAALKAEMARRPELAGGLAQLTALDEAVAGLPTSTLSREEVDRLVTRAMSPRRSNRWLPVALAAGLAGLMAGALLLRPRTVVTAVAGAVMAESRALIVGERVTNPDSVITFHGAAEVRLASGGTLRIAPETELGLAPSAVLRHGAVVATGDALELASGNRRLRVFGETIVSTEPVEGNFRGTQLTTEDLMSGSRFRVGLATAAVGAGGLFVYVLQGKAHVLSPDEPGVATITAPETWAATAGERTSEREPADMESGLPTVAATQDETAGVVELEVQAGGKPVADATVLLYREGEWDYATGLRRWTVAGTGRTDDSGLARMPAPPGGYLASVRSGVGPTARKTIRRPWGEPLTRVLVTLSAPMRLEGVTVEARSKKPVVPATVRARAADTPLAEAHSVEVGLDGRFAFGALTAGRWLIEGDAPGLGRAPSTEVEVPTTEPVSLVFRSDGFVEGTVLLPDGGPAAGANVLLIGAEPHSTHTSNSGSFSTEAPEGEWTVHARAGELVGRARGPVVVRGGATTSVGRIVLGRGARLSGTVTTGGARVSGARVSLTPHHGAGELAQGTSDGQGRYEVSVVPGIFDVETVAAGLASESLLGLRVAEEGTQADFELRRNGSIRGVVSDSFGRGVDGLSVIVTERSGAGGVQSQRLGTDGRFQLNDLSPGMWTAAATRDGELMGAQTMAQVKPGEVAEVSLTLSAPASIEGRLTWRCPGPPQRVQLDLNSVLDSSTVASKVVATDSPFTLLVSPGEYVVAAATPDGRCGSDGTPLSAETGKRHELALVLEARPATFEVHVVEPDGRPASEALVTVRSGPSPEDLLALGHTDADGVWRPGPGCCSPMSQLQKRPLLVLATRMGRAGQVERVAVGTKVVTVRLAPPTSLRVELEGATRGARTTVELVATPSFSWHDQVVTMSAELVLDEVPAGRLHLTATSSDGRTGDVELTAHPGVENRVKLVLEVGGALRGRTVDGAGKPVSGWVGVLNPQLEEVSEATAVDDSGLFELRPLAAGHWVLRWTAGGPGSVSKKIPVRVRRGEVTELGDLRVVGD